MLKKSAPLPVSFPPQALFLWGKGLYIFQPKMDVGESSPQECPQMRMERGQFEHDSKGTFTNPEVLPCLQEALISLEEVPVA